MCPPVLIGALYALWADTQVRPYTNHINTTRSAIRRSNTCICRDARECLAGGRPLCQSETQSCRDARPVRPSPFKVTGLHVMSFYNGRPLAKHSRASPQGDVTGYLSHSSSYLGTEKFLRWN